MPDSELPGDQSMHDGDETPSGVPGGEPEVADDNGAGRLIDIKIEAELQESYLTYAMSTIMDRALPDVRDGLKPSQRRILVAMNDLSLRPGKKHLKCAKICGDTSGNYHPHGESVIYPTMVGMAQAWKMRVPLVDPQGNFGSIDGDPPAAMRYTEARMHHAAVDLLTDLKLDTVDFQANYDDRLTEPMVLPGKFPNLLINGGMGIAVGMATSLPPHNPCEIFDAIVRMVDNPAITLPELMTDETDDEGNVKYLGVKGPDFPTGGVIMGRRGILEAYEHGRGRITLRGETHVEEMKNGRQQIVIESIPYSLVQNSLVEKIVEAVKDDRLKDISDVRNESGRNARTRIVIELKKGADPAVVENQIYQHTSLQQTFSIINIALVNRQPRTLGLRELIRLYIDHRVDVIRRRTAHLLREAKKRAHVLEGLIYAVCDIDEVIALIRSSKTRPEAIEKLMARRYRIPPTHEQFGNLPARMIARLEAAEAVGGVALTRVQADQIGSMRLIQLVGLEIERLINDYNEIVAQIEDYESILGDEQRVFTMIKEDCAEMRARYGAGPTGGRLTKIEEGAGDIDIEALIREEEVVVTITRGGFVKRVPATTYQAQGRGGKGIRASGGGEQDVVSHLFVASTHDDLLCFTDQGRVFKMKVYELPEMSRTSRGRAIQNYIQLRAGEKTYAYRAVKNFEAGSEHLLFVSRGGIVKRTPLKAYANVNKSGLIAVGLKEGDSLFDVRITSGNDDVILVTSAGMAIRFNEHEDRGGLRDMGRSAAGVKGIDLADGVEIIGTAIVPMEPAGEDKSDWDGPAVSRKDEDGSIPELLTITDKGYGKRTAVDEYRVTSEDGSQRSQSRGGKGRIDIRLSEKNGKPVAAFAVAESDDVVVISQLGQLVRISAGSISRYGRGTQGVRVVGLKSGDAVIAATRVVETEAEGAGEAPGDSGTEPDATDTGSGTGPETGADSTE